jgi:hypothetical protein
MRHIIVRAAVLASLVGGTSLAIAFSTGPDASRTGAPAVTNIPAEPLCTLCHSGNPVNDPAGLLEIVGLPGVYTAGQVIPVKVRLNFAHPLGDVLPYKWGFEMTAVQKANGRGVGTFTVSPGLKIKTPAPTSVYKTRRYIEHGADTSSTYTGRSGPVEWNFTWTAPAGDSGMVYLFVAGNAANGDGCSIPDPTFGCLLPGDHIFTAVDSMLGPSFVDVPPPVLPPLRYQNVLMAPSPNPFTRCLDLDFAIAQSGNVDLAVYDIEGRRIRTLVSGWHEAGQYANFWNGKRDDGSLVPNGMYFIKLRAPGLLAPLVRKVSRAV